MKMKNVDTTLEKMNSTMRESLSILDNSTVYISLVFILFLFNSCFFKNINSMASNMYEYTIVKGVMLILIIYISQKSCLLGILLAMSYVISLNYNSIMENFETTDMNQNTMVEDTMVEDTMGENMMDNTTEEVDMENTNDDQSVENFMTRPGLNLDINRSVMDTNETDKEDDLMNMNQAPLMNNTNTEIKMNNGLSPKDCMQNYNPTHENLGNVCDPVSTYQNEYNAQGLNYPIGFDKNQGGYTV